jgi:hypothetical protein
MIRIILGRLAAAELIRGEVKADAAVAVSFRKFLRLIVTREDYSNQRWYLSDSIEKPHQAESWRFWGLLLDAVAPRMRAIDPASARPNHPY